MTALVFAAHEARLMRRDMAAMLTAGRTYRSALVAAVLAGVYAGLLWLADFILAPHLADGLSADAATLATVSALIVMLFLLMASQALESVTRVYFGRNDLDLILSSPAPTDGLFAVRACMVAAQTALLASLIASPVVLVVAWRLGAPHLLAFPAVASLALVATGLGLIVSLLLLRTLGPKRARLTAQIVAAFIGAGFVISLQGIAILGGTGMDRWSVLTAPDTLAAMPAPTSPVWLLAHGALGSLWAVMILAVTSLALFAGVVRVAAARFAADALTASEVGRTDTGRHRFSGFSPRSNVRAALRRKEWALLKRDPWLLSQSLQQALYMIPPALLLFATYGEDRSVLFVVVPVLVMATGQLAGGLAWLAVSGEDARELIETAPVPARDVLIAKVQAVAGIVAWLIVPLSLALLPLSPKAALCTLLGAGASAASATIVQMWFRAQANRSFFRRRQVSSRAATLCEAMVSINCAAIACIVMAELPSYLVTPFVAVLAGTFAVAWLIRPVQNR